MIFHQNRFSCNIIPYFCRKLGKMLQNMSSAAVVIGAFRVKIVIIGLFSTQIFNFDEIWFAGSSISFP